ncbi:MAG: hypothetical protein AAF282_21465 [Cyanobacteria bacterium P01_A01_bin.15]
MVQLTIFFVVVAALLILVLQNLSPSLPLVVLGRSTGTLPLSLWLLIAIAVGSLCTLVIYQLVPKKRSYRPMGKRVGDDAPPEPVNRFVDMSGSNPSTTAPSTTDPSTTDRRQSRDETPPRNERPTPYDSDWETFKAPEQWDDWGGRSGDAFRDSPRGPSRDPGDPIDNTVRDIESGWGQDDYVPPPPPAYGDNTDIGWESAQSPRTHDEGWLYGSEPPADPPVSPEPEPPESSDDVYDASYRVIIPPYDAKDDPG